MQYIRRACGSNYNDGNCRKCYDDVDYSGGAGSCNGNSDYEYDHGDYERGADNDGDEKMVGHLTAADERRSVFKVERFVQRRERVLTFLNNIIIITP